MLGCFWISIIKFLLSLPSSDDASFEISSASTFWFLGTCTNSTSSNYRVKCLVSLRYFCILSSFASYSPLICSTTSFESLWINRFFTPSAFPSLNPVNMPSYSTSLLVAGNLSWTPYLSISPSGLVMTTLTPGLFWANELSVWIVHHSASLVGLSSSGKVNSAMKSAKACALMAVMGRYSISNWLSSIAH